MMTKTEREAARAILWREATTGDVMAHLELAMDHIDSLHRLIYDCVKAGEVTTGAYAFIACNYPSDVPPPPEATEEPQETP